MNVQQLLRFFELAKDYFESYLHELSRLDSVLGDGDHGQSMLKGFLCIQKEVAGKSFGSISELFSVAGRTMMREIGGTCGPLFATIFLQGALVSKGKETLKTEDFARMLRSSCDKIMALGKAKQGEKTMLDALIPAAEDLESSAAKGLDLAEALSSAAKVAKQGAEATKDMRATKGRGRYQGEQSIGHKDPGAASVALIVQSLADAQKGI